MNRNAQRRRGRSPSTRTRKQNILPFQLLVYSAHQAGDLILVLLRKLKILLCLYENHISQRKPNVAAHEIARRGKKHIFLFGLRNFYGPAKTFGLQGAALQQVEPEIAIRGEVRRELYVNRITVGGFKSVQNRADKVGEFCL